MLRYRLRAAIDENAAIVYAGGLITGQRLMESDVSPSYYYLYMRLEWPNMASIMY